MGLEGGGKMSLLIVVPFVCSCHSFPLTRSGERHSIRTEDN